MKFKIKLNSGNIKLNFSQLQIKNLFSMNINEIHL